jgi:mortality factor 4-like protein 1
MIEGVYLYFDKLLNVLLLYPQEKTQYEKLISENSTLEVGQLYGGDHLLRLFLELPLLLNHCNIEAEYLNNIKELIQELIR